LVVVAEAEDARQRMLHVVVAEAEERVAQPSWLYLRMQE
jgi:hypothetical protein